MLSAKAKTPVKVTRTSAARVTGNLEVERLEDRAMMAGNVSAWVSQGTLYIRGDDASNGVIVRQVSSTTYTVTGTSGNYLLWDSTRVNGSGSAQTFSGVYDDIDVSLNDGNDRIEFRGTSRSSPIMLTDDLRITGGRGSDALYMENVRNRDPNDRMVVDMGQDNDSVAMYYVTSRDYLNIFTGDGNDSVNFVGQSGFGDTGNSVLVSLGTGNDTMKISGSFWVSTITMDGESGTDKIYTDRTPTSRFRYSRFEQVIWTGTFS